jgi:hypothetical protein
MKRRLRVSGIFTIVVLAFLLCVHMLYLFSMIWMHGVYYVYEPNRVILAGETVAYVVAVGYIGYRVALKIKRRVNVG